MQREIKRYEYFCAGCGKKVSSPSKLKYTMNVGPCGLTDYYRAEDWCKTCFDKSGHLYQRLS